MMVRKSINLNGQKILLIGMVVGGDKNEYIVSFSHGGTNFAGSWRKDEVTVVSCPKDTDGDGNCGQRYCPYCSEPEKEV